MKVDTISDVMYTVYLNKIYLSDVDFNSKESIELYLKKIFSKLRKRFNKEISGFFEINIYHNDYNAVLVINKEDLDYYNYFNNTIEMQVNVISDSKFLYEIGDVFLFDLYKNNNIYFYNDKYYIELDNNVNISILEHVDIIFGDIVDTIIDAGKKIEINV